VIGPLIHFVALRRLAEITGLRGGTILASSDGEPVGSTRSTIMNFRTFAICAALIATAFAAADVSAQTYSGGRQGPRGHGYSYTATRSGSTVTGSVQTNGGYGATGSHTSGVTANGVQTGTSTVTTNNGSTVTTNSYRKDGYVAGAATATGPGGQTVTGGGVVYVPQ
jgi:hypothetical protein